MITVRVVDRAGSFAEDKDIAAKIRDADLRPAVGRGEAVRIDFGGVQGATQSFIHAMISDVIRKEGASALDRIDFKGCNATVRSVVEIVVEYSQLGEADSEQTDMRE